MVVVVQGWIHNCRHRYDKCGGNDIFGSRIGGVG